MFARSDHGRSFDGVEASRTGCPPREAWLAIDDRHRPFAHRNLCGMLARVGGTGMRSVGGCRGFSSLLAIGSVIAAGLAACDGNVLNPDPIPPAPVSALPAQLETPVSATGEDDGAYDRMCRNYCTALQETDFYYCIDAGSAAQSCTHEVSAYLDLCVHDRCVPRLVKQSLCLQQCDVLSPLYEQACATSTDPTLCPSAPSDHDLGCRAGCGPSSQS